MGITFAQECTIDSRFHRFCLISGWFGLIFYLIRTVWPPKDTHIANNALQLLKDTLNRCAKILLDFVSPKKNIATYLKIAGRDELLNDKNV